MFVRIALVYTKFTTLFKRLKPDIKRLFILFTQIIIII